MKGRVYRSLCLVAIGLLTACGKNNQPPTVVATPTVTPTPIAATPTMPAPVATPTPTPSLPSAPSPKQPAIPAPPPGSASKPTLAELPKSLYPDPTPVPIIVPSEPVKTKTNSKTEPISKLKLPLDSARQITPVGIGDAKIGMTFKELKQKMGAQVEFPVKTNFIEGFDAIAVTKAGTVQYYIPYPTGTNFTDADRIQHLMTDNPNYRTQQGVGPGTSIGQAVSVYGNATLSMSKDNESREFINFTQHPNGLAFRPKPVGKRNFAGDYPESNDDYLKTQKYDKQAAIGQITVSCAEDKCDLDR
ncbi:hypothetical protein [Chamaesiphon sp. OTE_75_metabat_556]|uniref:hypothetical protein n=1 Tax=Chamaesiphon sp. OTE_75_metabat_556 TaxID=2964692 RepID=UPI00286B37F9|nr:hypothetical protein [Chamaesiphon sp. OTE_75_metabat_556]